MQKNLRIRKLQQKNLRIFPFFERKIKNGTDYVYIHNPFHSDCRQTPKLGVLFAVFLFYTHCINYSGSDSNDEKTID